MEFKGKTPAVKHGSWGGGGGRGGGGGNGGGDGGSGGEGGGDGGANPRRICGHCICELHLYLSRYIHSGLFQL